MYESPGIKSVNVSVFGSQI